MIDLPTFPLLAYHPIHGAMSFDDYDSAVKTMTVRTDWFKTKEEADAHRHEGEAAIVIHNARRGQIVRHEEGGAGVVKHSVTHQDDVDRAMERNAAVAEAAGAPVPETKDETRAADLTA